MGPLAFLNFFFLGLLIGFISRGKLIRIGQLPIRFGLLAIGLLMLRGFLSERGPRFLSESVMSMTFILVLIGLLVILWFNRRIAGVKLMMLGAASNMLVMSLNGGYMPVQLASDLALTSPELYAYYQSGGAVMHSIAMNDSTRLPWLADWIEAPAFLWYTQTTSIGDLLIGFSLTYLLACAMLGRPYGWWGPRVPDPAPLTSQPVAA